MISFISVFPPYRGGISNFSDYLYTHLSKSREVVPVNFKLLYPDILFPGATQFQENAVKEYAERQLHSCNPLNWNRTGKRIGLTSPDVLMFSYWHPFFIPAYNRIIKKVKKLSPTTKVCTIAHNVSPHEGFPFSEQLMKSFFGNNDLVVTLSNQTEKEFKKLDTSTECLKLFHPVYERAFPKQPVQKLREEYSLKNDEQVPLFFGLIREYKGLDILIKSLNKIDLKALKIRPFIVGEFYTDKNKYLDLINEDHKDQYVVIDRFVSQKEANEIFTLSDALILPYKSASQSGVFNDALNFNLPAIVSDKPGLIEHLTHKETGLIFESENVEELQNLLLDFFTNHQLRAQISSNLEHLKADLSWDNFTSKLTLHL
ncbi:MAG: glycosyltransferase [Balneolaceae bacterium]